MTMGNFGLLFGPVGTFSIFRIISRPSSTRPNTTCLLSRKLHLAHVMKNWQPLVSLPLLAIDSNPGESCFNEKFSSGKVPPYMLITPVPSPCGKMEKHSRINTERMKNIIFSIEPFTDQMVMTKAWLSLGLSTIIATHIDKIAALDHEIFNNSMKIGSFVAEWYSIFPMLSRAELSEIFARFWHNVGK